jgi:hypothetical protein
MTRLDQNRAAAQLAEKVFHCQLIRLGPGIRKVPPPPRRSYSKRRPFSMSHSLSSYLKWLLVYFLGLFEI